MNNDLYRPAPYTIRGLAVELVKGKMMHILRVSQSTV